MLPDFPAQKDRLLRLWTDYLRQKEREYRGYFATIPSYSQHEGNRWGVERGNGTVSESGFKLVEAGVSVHVDEVPNLTPEKIAQKIDTTAQKMARQTVQGILEDINRAVHESGRAIDAEGRRFSKESFLEALDSIVLSFDENGNPTMPTVIMHPKLWETIKDDVRTWEQDPEFVARREQIIERKREAWRDRESRRKLVD
jgi:hypothetical protein